MSLDSHSVLAVRTLHGAVTNVLRQEIISGLLPAGTKLNQDELAQRFGVSRMPVREALLQLEAEGLVTIYPHRGAVVAELSLEDIKEVFLILATLEGLAAREGVPNLTEADLNKMAALLCQMRESEEMETWLEVAKSFHMVVYQAARRPRLLKLITQQRDTVAHYMNAYVMLLGRREKQGFEHGHLLEACRAGDAERAERFTQDHLTDIAADLMEYLRSNRG